MALPDTAPFAVYLDSNVLFSASYIPASPFLQFWKMASVTPVVSDYAITEVRNNIASAEHQQRFEEILARTRLVSDASTAFVPASIKLANKDRPILAAAIAASADFLLTGDKKHFANLYWQRVSGVLVMTPADFLILYQDRVLP